jgi:hypothetical protein
MAPINTLALVRQQLIKQQRLSAAQRMASKAYRGVPYAEAHHTAPQAADLTYRGHHYEKH